MITIINYGLGNLASVKNALDKIGVSSIISDNPEVIRKADGIILPGVGAAGDGMRNLKAKDLDKVIKEEVKKGKPFIGLCLGMQLLFDYSEEGDIKCLGLIPGRVTGFSFPRHPERSAKDLTLKIPQIGWNDVRVKGKGLRVKGNLFKNIPDKSYFYFVHSYYCEPSDKSVIIGETNYGINFCSVLNSKNIFATQFHPEKSGIVGLKLLENFVKECI